MMTRLFDLTTPFDRMRGELDQMVQDFLAPLSMRLWEVGVGAFPAMNIWDDEGHVYAEAEVPGLKLDDLEVLVVGNELTLKGRRGNGKDQDGVTYHRRERGVGEFERTVRLPVEIDAANVTADLRDGVLLITMPKAESARPRRIEVKSARN